MGRLKRWLILFVGVGVALILVVLIGGLMLPEEHHASQRITEVRAERGHDLLNWVPGDLTHRALRIVTCHHALKNNSSDRAEWRRYGAEITVEKVAPVERGGPFQRLRRALGHGRFEPRHVDVDRPGRDSHGAPLDHQARRRRVAQRLAQQAERLAEARPGLTVGDVPPQEDRQLVAGMRLAGSEGQVGQQRLGLSGGEMEGDPRPERRLETTEEGQTNRGHRFHGDYTPRDRRAGLVHGSTWDPTISRLP